MAASRSRPILPVCSTWTRWWVALPLLGCQPAHVYLDPVIAMLGFTSAPLMIAVDLRGASGSRVTAARSVLLLVVGR
jgi:hypothetical protein